MSHSIAQIKVNNTIYHGEYDGTCDFVMPRFFDTWQERDKHWRNHNRECKCNSNTFIEADYATTYGYGFAWKIKVCMLHKEIKENLEPQYDSNSYEDGLPDWFFEYWKDKND